MYATIEGWKMYYGVKGSGEPILFLHGTPTSAFLWRKQVKELSKSYRVYAIDLPGWARSGKPDNFDYKLESYAEIIKKFLDKARKENYPGYP
jgi:pimeloyl-ACP methyl ester carboxylesterase